MASSLMQSLDVKLGQEGRESISGSASIKLVDQSVEEPLNELFEAYGNNSLGINEKHSAT